MTDASHDHPPSEPTPESIATWLSRQGYPLELRVERACVAHQASDVLLGRRYLDPTDKATIRETDVVPCWQALGRGGRTGTLYLAMECKSDDRPWIGLSATGSATWHDEQSMFDLIYSEHLGARANRDWLATAMAHRIPGSSTSIFEPGVLSHSVVTKRDRGGSGSGDGRQDPAYSAVMAAFSASKGVLADLARDELAAGGAFVGIGVVPVVVTTGPLFRAWLGDDEGLQVEAVELLRVAFRPFAEPRTRVCFVLRERALDSWLDRVEASVRRLVPPADLEQEVGLY